MRLFFGAKGVDYYLANDAGSRLRAGGQAGRRRTLQPQRRLDDCAGPESLTHDAIRAARSTGHCSNDAYINPFGVATARLGALFADARPARRVPKVN
jgi:hypothetical protein